MSRYADLEIHIRKQAEQSYTLAFRFNSPDDAAEQRSSSEPLVRLDPSTLTGDDAPAYAASLTTSFFTAEVRQEFSRYRAAAAAQSAILRVRLSIDASAPELHGVHWEILRDPDQPGAYLFCGEQTIVSRFLNSGSDWRPIRLQPKSALRALVAIANPASSTRYALEPVNVASELASAQQALSGIEVVALAPGGALSLNSLAAKLREGCDILYLVCHGKLVDDEPYLFLDEGQPTPGAGLVQAIRELDQRPRMVVMASCQSAGQGGVGLSALGPRLAEAGVPAVIAMQGSVYMSTSAAFMKRFFTELLADGQIDRAVSVARGDVRKADDFWMPVLFLRLRNGRIWYEPGFSGTSENQFEQWKSICNSVRSGRFIPILGPELGEDIFGGSEDLSHRLADDHNFPMGSQDKWDLAKVTQFIAVQQKRGYAYDAVQTEFLQQMARRLGAAPGATQTAGSLLDAAVARCRQDESNPYTILSRLPASIFLNASYHPMLLRMLKAEGKTPEPVVALWRGEAVPQKPQPQAARPTLENPWVYHIFGIFGKPNSLVLTEDDFLDYLIAVSRLDLLLPTLVGQLMQSSLLFLGFRLDDWRFRVLFRMIVTRDGTRTMRDLAHVGVQVTPGEQSVADVNRARKYMESYFQGQDDAPDISIYWGSAADFLKQMQQQRKTCEIPDAVPVTQGGADDWF